MVTLKGWTAPTTAVIFSGRKFIQKTSLLDSRSHTFVDPQIKRPWMISRKPDSSWRSGETIGWIIHTRFALSFGKGRKVGEQEYDHFKYSNVLSLIQSAFSLIDLVTVSLSVIMKNQTIYLIGWSNEWTTYVLFLWSKSRFGNRDNMRYWDYSDGRQNFISFIIVI